MRRTRFDEAHCPVARTTDLLGDWWTPLVLRELLLGQRRFNEIQQRLEVSRAILSQRLERLTAEGVVRRVQYEQAPPRFEYHLTDKGRALWDVILVMWQFGDDWMFDESPGALVELVDRATGEPLRPRVVDAGTGEAIEHASTRVRLRRAAGA
jgi:DNA-binding HxlR family transcriptional regulator